MSFSARNDKGSGIPGPQIKRIICPSCKKSFVVGSGETVYRCAFCSIPLMECPSCKYVILATAMNCPFCNVIFTETEIYYCPICDAQVDADAVKCANCGTSFAVENAENGTAVSECASLPSEVITHTEKVGLQQSECEFCHSSASSVNPLYQCAICKRYFCLACPPTHIPPSPTLIETKVTYNYKMNNVNAWKKDVTRFTDTLPEPLCNICYPIQFNKAVTRLEAKLKNWKLDMMREGQIEIREEMLPQKMTVSHGKTRGLAKELLKKLEHKA